MEIFAINADNMDVLPGLPSKSFNLVVADPPFGLDEGNRASSRHGHTALQSNGKKVVVKSRKHDSKDWDKAPPPPAFFKQIFRVGQRHIIFGENYLNFPQKASSSGRIYWDKVNGKNDFSDGELIWTNLHSSIRSVAFMWNGMLQAGSLLDGRKPLGDKSRHQTRIHPNEKPVALYLHFIQKYLKPGMRLLDPHGGSGSIMLAYFQANIPDTQLLWIEKNEEYFNEALQRLQAATPKLQVVVDQIPIIPRFTYSEQAKIFA